VILWDSTGECAACITSPDKRRGFPEESSNSAPWPRGLAGTPKEVV
jgi:hypothetical protein